MESSDPLECSSVNFESMRVAIFHIFPEFLGIFFNMQQNTRLDKSFYDIVHFTKYLHHAKHTMMIRNTNMWLSLKWLLSKINFRQKCYYLPTKSISFLICFSNNIAILIINMFSIKIIWENQLNWCTYLSLDKISIIMNLLRTAPVTSSTWYILPHIQ